MSSIGLSVPPGLTISTEACQEYQQNGKKLAKGLWEEVLEGLEIVEKDMGASLGDPSKPLLLSVRSGAAVRLVKFNIFRAMCQWIMKPHLTSRIYNFHSKHYSAKLYRIVNRLVCLIFFFFGIDFNAWDDGHCP